MNFLFVVDGLKGESLLFLKEYISLWEG